MRFDPRWIVGKTIADVEMRPFGRANGGGRATDPVIRFTDGSWIAFLTQETDDFDYGVTILYCPAKRHAIAEPDPKGESHE